MSTAPLSSSPEEPSVIVGGREQLFHLLAEAAEVEHALMCTYLYAAFSLKQGNSEDLSADEAAAVARWRKVIMSVAIEEMVHLLLVANLSIAVGSRPHFGRPNFPVATGHFPSGLILKLAPFCEETLDHFIFVERPRGVVLEDGSGFHHEAEYVREEAYHGLMPSLQEYATVGHLYDALLTNLDASAHRLGEKALFVGPVEAQMGRKAVDLDRVMTVSNLDEARTAVGLILEQGEGSLDDRANSHYQRFLSVRTELRQLCSANPRFSPAWPTVHNPVMRRPPEPENKVFVNHSESARVLDLANAIYGLLLRLLVQAFGQTGVDSARQQRQHVSAAIELMQLLGRTASALAQRPASADTPGENAGVTFTMLRSVEPLFRGPIETRLVIERLRELAVGARDAIAICPELAGMDRTLDTLATRFGESIAEKRGSAG
ncbi:MAG: ferritin-like protein [Pseudomonadota bacterium]|nr:ferritin-like protein [Pseudomonadota bacterium]